MKKAIISNLKFLIFNLLSLFASAQHTVNLQIKTLPEKPVTDVVYITGNFNGWNPKDEDGHFQETGRGYFTLKIDNVDGGDYEFKFTRGSWDNVETDAAGKDIANRIVHIQSDTTLSFSIAGWKDNFEAAKKRNSTATAQVKIIDTAFTIPQLNRTRRIWLYLPKDYAASGRHYPVIYMHDGQNLFDDATSFAGEWGVDETMDSVKNACIVVGIDNGGGKRMNEYNPDDAKQFGKGEGKEYLAFIVKTLKPYIDKQYRTLNDKKHTYIAGSSMGGLISFYAGLYYPEVFGGIGVFSPSFWIVPQIREEIKQLAKKNLHGTQRYYFYMGEKEGGQMVPDMNAVLSDMQQRVNPQTIKVINPNGRHNEAAWRAEFAAFYAWISK